MTSEVEALLAEATPGPWRVEQGVTHLEIRAPHQRERSVARVYDEFDARLICELVNRAREQRQGGTVEIDSPPGGQG